MLKKSITKNSIVLTLFAFATAGLLAATYQGTAEKIAVAEKKAAEQALLEIVPDNLHDNDMLDDVVHLTEKQAQALGLTSSGTINIAKKQGQPVAAIFRAIAHDGYSGDITLIIGVFADGSIAGVRAFSHKETPGLGDKVDIKKSNWILGFNGKSFSNLAKAKWKVKKDGGEFDQFTGATITPRAVVNRVRQTLEFYEQNKALILPKVATDTAE